MLDVLEVAVGFVDNLAVGEGVVVLGQNLMKIVELMLVDDENQHRLFRLGVGADGTHLGTAVVKFTGDFGDDCLFVGGDHGEFVGGFGAAEQLVAHKGGDETINNAQRHRLIVQGALGVHKEGDNRHQRVECKGDDEKVGVGFCLIDVTGNHVGAAGGGVVAKAHAVHKAADHTAEDDGIDGVVSLGVVLDKGEVGILQA